MNSSINFFTCKHIVSGVILVITLIFIIISGLFGCNSRTDKTNFKSYKINNHWFGHYHLSIDYGKLDEFSSMFISYDIFINQDSCVFSGMGYKTDFSDLCRIEEKDGKLLLFYVKSIEGDGFSNHSDENLLATLIKDKNQYYIKSSIIADKNWEYNKKLVISISKL